MEKRLIRYILVVIIFFVGLSMGIDYHDQNRKSGLNKQISTFESIITKPGNDFEPLNPIEDIEDEDEYPVVQVEHNLFTSLAKDGEYILKKGLDLILDGANEILRLIFGMKES
ncbi:MAG: hypothetical protein GX676_05700 [Bacilli bacterium]|nr:hypothetical protein [Bacilli bacterium]